VIRNDPVDHGRCKFLPGRGISTCIDPRSVVTIENRQVPAGPNTARDSLEDGQWVIDMTDKRMGNCRIKPAGKAPEVGCIADAEVKLV
jgi:hypothetical protein